MVKSILIGFILIAILSCKSEKVPEFPSPFDNVENAIFVGEWEYDLTFYIYTTKNLSGSSTMNVMHSADSGSKAILKIESNGTCTLSGDCQSYNGRLKQIERFEHEGNIALLLEDTKGNNLSMTYNQKNDILTSSFFTMNGVKTSDCETEIKQQMHEFRRK